MTASWQPLLSYEEIITDFRALVSLVLHANENCEPAEWADMKFTVNTSLYLMLDMLRRLEDNHDRLWKIELAAGRAERGETVQ